MGRTINCMSRVFYHTFFKKENRYMCRKRSRKLSPYSSHWLLRNIEIRFSIYRKVFSEEGNTVVMMQIPFLRIAVFCFTPGF